MDMTSGSMLIISKLIPVYIYSIVRYFENMLSIILEKSLRLNKIEIYISKEINSKISCFILIVDRNNRQRKGHLIHKVSRSYVLLNFIVIYV